MRVLYLTPMKSPDDPVPSGDRTIARATEKLLERAGFDVLRPTPFTSFLTAPDDGRMNILADEAQREIARIMADHQRPDLVFTYHCYYKAPDLIGPAVAERFQIPYIIAEPSHAAKRANGAWARWHRESERALRTASLALVAGRHDRDGLAQCLPEDRLVDWPPFIDDTLWPAMPRWAHRETTRLITVAMMREGDKLESYRLLAHALKCVAHRDWHLTLVGDGPTRDEVLALFEPFGDRVVWRGQLHGLALADAYADADLFVWPAVNEAAGMVFLEAALQSCPSVAGDEGGVSALVHDGVTGCLVPRRDSVAFAAALDTLIGQADRLRQLGEGAYAMAQSATLDAAVVRLRDTLARLGVCP